MPDWRKSMQQSFEYYIVDPGTWREIRQLKDVRSCTINRDGDTDTLGSATIDVTDMLEECYVRIYLVTIQNGITERHSLGTFLVQNPSYSFDGKARSVSLDAYTPLMELKENQPPLGYSLSKDDNIMDKAYQIVRDGVRAPVVKTECTEPLYSDFVADTNDNWLTFTKALIGNAKYEFSLDEMSRILFSPIQELDSLQPVWTFDDGNSSILLPDISLSRDLYGIPNVVEVIYSQGGKYVVCRAINDDENSPVSVVNRGREIVHRVAISNEKLDLSAEYAEEYANEYAKTVLKDMSSIVYSVSYTHAYCPVRLGDCVRLDYKRAGLSDIRAKVVSQSIKCEAGCPVSEKAVFTKKLWG